MGQIPDQAAPEAHEIHFLMRGHVMPQRRRRYGLRPLYETRPRLERRGFPSLHLNCHMRVSDQCDDGDDAKIYVIERLRRSQSRTCFH